MENKNAQSATTHSNIYLIGFMGSGKTTMGRTLARKLQARFIDLDHEIERKARLSIPEIFRIHGEDYFRGLEHEILTLNDSKELTVVATGGGTPCYLNNMEWIKAHGVSVYLKMSARAILTRLNQKEQQSRPLLKNKSPEELNEFVEQKMQERRYFYDQADYIVDGLKITAEELLNIISGKDH